MKCADCKKREAILKFSKEPSYALSHGFGIINLCRPCYIVRLEKILEEIQKNIKD